MPQEAQLSHRNIKNANLPYVSNLSPTVTDACFIPGSVNIQTSIAGYAQRRLGFSDFVESTPTTFTSCRRLFTWDRTDGTFIEMACDIVGSQALVYKRVVGTDPSFVLIFTDSSSMTPFDFVVSNNTVYFSNGNVAKKWDPVNGISNWGISIGSVNNAVGPTIAGNGANGSAGGGTLSWTNPNNASSTVADATVFMHNGQSSVNLVASQFGFGIPSTTTITGIQVTINCSASLSNSSIHVSLNKAGNVTGVVRGVLLPTSSADLVLGYNGDLWGTAWTSNDINQTNFGLNIQAYIAHGNTTYRVRNVRVTVFGIGGPTVTVSGSAGTFSATIGYQYVFCYGNSNTGHLSSPSPASASTGVFTNKLNVGVDLTASTDPQVNQIRVFRSTDSVAAGITAQNFFELPTSPYPNTTATITDNTPDGFLIVDSLAPTPGFNDPPTPGQCPVYFSGRIWLFAGNRVNFSGLEEILQGVPEESFPSGVAGNFWAFDEGPKALAVAGSQDAQTLAILSGGRLYAIVGSTLDTFRRFTVSQRRGCRNLAAVSTLGGMVAWLDSANQIWSTDGSTLNEIGLPIRPDLIGIDQQACSMTFHVKDNFHWLLFSTGTLIFCYDLDTEQWMPPWNFSATYLWSGEVSAGNYKLQASTGQQNVQMSDAAHNDIGVTYPVVARTSNTSMVPDFGTRFSSAGLGMYDQPTRTGQPWFFQIDTNATIVPVSGEGFGEGGFGEGGFGGGGGTASTSPLTDVAMLVDDDPLEPLSPPYQSIFGQKTTVEKAFNRRNGQKLLQNVFAMTEPMSRWISWQFSGAKADDNLKIYGWFTAYKESMGK